MSKMERKIGSHIREVRLERKLSQEALAEMCGFSNTTLSSYENGRKTPSLDTIARIAKKLNVSIERLYYGNENISFIISEADEGRKIVNSVYFLWKSGVIYPMADPAPGISPFMLNRDDELHGFYLLINRFPLPIARLLKSLVEYQRNENTYTDPEQYLELLLSSVANEINGEIKKEETQSSSTNKK